MTKIKKKLYYDYRAVSTNQSTPHSLMRYLSSHASRLALANISYIDILYIIIYK